MVPRVGVSLVTYMSASPHLTCHSGRWSGVAALLVASPPLFTTLTSLVFSGGGTKGLGFPHPNVNAKIRRRAPVVRMMKPSWRIFPYAGLQAGRTRRRSHGPIRL